jgi:RNA polymerase sigma factor (sigma-70 family)
MNRYRPIIRAVCRGYRIPGSDVDDVIQTVCLRLLENLGRIHTPQALPAWIIITTRRECLRFVRRRSQLIPMDSMDELDGHETHGIDADLLRAELAEAVRDGLAELTRTQRDLLLLLADDQPHSYREIGRFARHADRQYRAHESSWPEPVAAESGGRPVYRDRVTIGRADIADRRMRGAAQVVSKVGPGQVVRCRSAWAGTSWSTAR